MQIDKQYKEQLEDFKATKGYQYALDVVNEDIPADKYIVIMCQNFLRDVQSIENDDFDYFLDLNYFTRVTKLLKLMKMGSGLSQGKTVYNSLAGFQWLFIINALVWRIKKDPEKRRYEKSVLLIGRKSGKTFLVSVIMIILMMVEPKNSQFYSVAPNLELSSLLLQEMKNQITFSPFLENHFKINRDNITFKDKNNVYKPLATTNNRMDGKICRLILATRYK